MTSSGLSGWILFKRCLTYMQYGQRVMLWSDGRAAALLGGHTTERVAVLLGVLTDTCCWRQISRSVHTYLAMCKGCWICAADCAHDDRQWVCFCAEFNLLGCLHLIVHDTYTDHVPPSTTIACVQPLCLLLPFYKPHLSSTTFFGSTAAKAAAALPTSRIQLPCLMC